MMKWGFTRPDGTTAAIELENDSDLNVASLFHELHRLELDGELDPEGELPWVPDLLKTAELAFFSAKYLSARTKQNVAALAAYLRASGFDSLKLVTDVPAHDVRQQDHYAHGIQPIEYMESRFSDDEWRGAMRFNVIKYVSRFDRKDGVRDLEKALDYLERLIAHERSRIEDQEAC